MIITRWQAQIVPNVEQIFNLFKAEGLIPFSDTVRSRSEIAIQRRPFDEVRMVAEGELLLNISGNKMLLRAGDKVIIPAHTKHSMRVDSDRDCLCVCAKRVF
jgi:mannose-6-phosphate isomerase-like protein (cupin superfamily)